MVQVQEIMELKRALAKTRQDLQKTRSRRQSQDTRSSSDEVGEENNAFPFECIPVSILQYPQQ